jgi:hypothetical protein
MAPYSAELLVACSENHAISKQKKWEREKQDISRRCNFPILLHDDECGLIMTVSAVAHDDLHKQPSFSSQPPPRHQVTNALHNSEQFYVVPRGAAAACEGLVPICDKYVPKGTPIL